MLLLFAFFIFNTAQADSKFTCVDLKNSSLTEQDIEGYSHNITLSKDQKLIASYQFNRSKELAIFKLWDSQTGKLLKTEKVNKFQERSSQASLHFSPDNSFIYLLGMTDGVPFWHWKKNKLISSPCETAMGVTELELSDDLEVAYTQTVDSFRSLCSTQKSEQLAYLPYAHGSYIFDQKRKHLTSTFVFADNPSYQKLINDSILGTSNKQHVTLYKSPVPDHPYNPTSNDSFASLLIRKYPKQHLFIAKSKGAVLSLSLWGYESEKVVSPKNIYQHSIQIPELASKQKPLANSYNNMLVSPDKQQALFLSKSGMLILFDIQTGKLIWKHHLPTSKENIDLPNYSFNNLLKTEEDSSTLIAVIEQKTPQTLLLFDWGTGKQRKLNISDDYGLINSLYYHQYNQYLLFEPIAHDSNRWLLINWQTGQKKFLDLPDGFKPSMHHQIGNHPQLIFEPSDYNKDYLKRDKNLFNILVLDLNTGKYWLQKKPSSGQYFAQKYIHLDHGYHRIYTAELPANNGKKKYGIKLYDTNNQPPKILQTVDAILYEKFQSSDRATPKYQIISYDKQKQQSQYCSFQLEHKH